MLKDHPKFLNRIYILHHDNGKESKFFDIQKTGSGIIVSVDSHHDRISHIKTKTPYIEHVY